jgi:hypothetical protein
MYTSYVNVAGEASLQYVKQEKYIGSVRALLRLGLLSHAVVYLLLPPTSSLYCES